MVAVLALQDLRERRLPNKLIAAYFFGLLLGSWLHSQPPDLQAWGIHLAIGLIAFVFLFTLFWLGGMGGGDVKFGTVIFLFVPLHMLSPVLLTIGLTGIFLALAGMIADFLTPKVISPTLKKLFFLLSAKRGVPYGVALAAGAAVSTGFLH